MIFKPHVPVFFWPSRHNFRDSEVNSGILQNFHIPIGHQNSGLKYKIKIPLGRCFLFNEPTDSRFPKIRIKIKMGFWVFLFAPIRNSSPHLILCDAFAKGVNERGENVSWEV